jgi:hypothetical protein
MQNEYAIQTINLTKTFRSKAQGANGGFFRRTKVTIKAVDNLNI